LREREGHRQRDAGARKQHQALIRKAWLHALKGCEFCPPYISLLRSLKFEEKQVEKARKEGAELARLGVPPQYLVLAVDKYVQCHLALTGTGQLKATPQWAADYKFMLLAGYHEHAESERRTLEQQLEDTEERNRENLAELRDVYEKERRRLAQDLHDEVGHDLIVLKLYLELVARDLGERDVDKIRHKLNESVTLIQHAIKGVRHLTFALGPAIWDNEDFVSWVKLYVRQFAARTELKVRFNARNLKAPLTKEYETALYKALQGALANIAAHSGAKRVAISLSSDETSVIMTVADDGKGFDVQSKLKAPQRSFGLRTMRERIESLGGSILFRSGPTRIDSDEPGTLVEFRLPIEPGLTR
jgi:signal transduction histidine kinase